MKQYLFLIVSLLIPSLCARDVLNVPANYVYGGGVDYDPTIPNDAIIEIAVSNVSLDLSGNTLDQVSTNTQPGLVGILVDPGLTNITIKNGVIRDVSSTGILVGEGSQVTIDNMLLIDCKLRAIDLEGTVANPINNSIIQNSTIMASSQGIGGDYVVSLSNVTSSKLSNCSFRANGIVGNTIDILHLDTCNDSEIIDCDIKDSRGDSIICTHLINSNNNIFDNLRIIANTASNGDLSAIISDTLCSGNIFSECVVQANVTTASGVELNGYYINGNDESTLQNCQARLNEALGDATNVYGFRVENSSTIKLLNCISSHNEQEAVVTTTGNVYGFFYNNNTKCSVDTSIAESNTGGGAAYGMVLANSTDCELKDNQFLFNTGAMLNRGLLVSNSINHVATRNIAFANGTTGQEQIDGLSSLETSDLNATTANLAVISNPWINIRAFHS